MSFSLKINTYDEQHSGYGNAAEHLRRVLHDKVDLWEGSQNVLNFCKPEDYIFRNGITIGYTPWESTEIPNSWFEPMKKVDSLWTTSDWCASLFESWLDIGAGGVFVLPHGIDRNWTPIRRTYNKADGPFVFLHVGEPAVRKGGDIVFDTWYRYAKDRTDMKLIFKCRGGLLPRILDEDGSIVATPYDIPNIEIHDGDYSPAEMWKEYALAHCLIYPSRGEGFGLIPLEAMATGLPTILPGEGGTKEFSHYGYRIFSSRMVKTPYQDIHPGYWMDFRQEDIWTIMRQIMDDYTAYSTCAMRNANNIHKRYDWNQIGEALAIRIGHLMDR